MFNFNKLELKCAKIFGENSSSQAKYGSMHVHKYADPAQQGISKISSLVSYFSLILKTYISQVRASLSRLFEQPCIYQ